MYPPPHHQIDDRKKMIAVVEAYPLGMLVSADKHKPFITHIPFVYDAQTERLVAHIDKNNPQVEMLKDGTEVTVVFRGPDTYISPSVYTTTQLPTWNYIIVHLTGRIKLINDVEDVKQSLVRMTAFLEGKTQSYRLDPDNKRMDALVNYIQAFAIEITQWEGKFKLSQDKNTQDQHNAKEALKNHAKLNRDTFIEGMYE